MGGYGVEARSNWYSRTAKEINLHRINLNKKDAGKYKLDLLLRVVDRVDEFSIICGECQNFQGEISRLVADLGNLIQLPDSKEGRKSYHNAINAIVKHLQKTHKLVSAGQNMGIWMAAGTGLGAAIGAALDNPGIGTPLGVAIGLAIGSYLDRKAKKEGRVI